MIGGIYSISQQEVKLIVCGRDFLLKIHLHLQKFWSDREKFDIQTYVYVHKIFLLL